METFFDDDDNAQVEEAIRVIENGDIYSIFDSDILCEYAQILTENFAIEPCLILTTHWVSIAPYNSESWLYHGISFLQNEQNDEAEEALRKSISLHPSDTEAYFQLGFVYEKKLLFDDAIEMYEIILGYDNTDADAHYFMGNSYLSMDNFEKATTCFEAALAIDKEFIEAWLGLAKISEEADNIETAIQIYDKVLDIEPFLDEIWGIRGALLAAIEEYDKALDSFDFAISIGKDIRFYLYEKARLLLTLDRTKEAETLYLEIIAQKENQEPNEPIAYSQLGWISLEEKNYKKSLRYFLKAIKVDADFSRSWYGIAMLYNAVAKYEKSLLAIEKAIEIATEWDDPSKYQFLKAEILEELGYTEESIKLYKETLSVAENQDSKIWHTYGEILLKAGKDKEAMEAFRTSALLGTEFPK